MFSVRCSQLLQLPFGGLHVIQLVALEYCEGFIWVLSSITETHAQTVSCHFFSIYLGSWRDMSQVAAEVERHLCCALPLGMSSMRIYHNIVLGFWSSPAASRTFCTSCSQSELNWKQNVFQFWYTRDNLVAYFEARLQLTMAPVYHPLPFPLPPPPYHPLFHPCSINMAAENQNEKFWLDSKSSRAKDQVSTLHLLADVAFLFIFVEHG